MKKSKASCKYIFIILLILSGVLFTCFSGIQGFWFDELFSIGVVRKSQSFSDLLKTYFSSETTNPPLYDIILFFIYRCVPSNEIWLLSINSVFWGIGTIFIACTTYSASKRPSVLFFVLVFSAINVFIINNMVWELRSYSLLYMLAAIVQFLYFKAKSTESYKNLIILGIAMVSLAFTHYFGDIIIFCYALADLLLFIKKKISLKCLIPYIMCILTMGPYMLTILHNDPNIADKFWIQPPTAYIILDTMVTLLGNKYSFIIWSGLILFLIIAISRHHTGIYEINAAISIMIIFTVCCIVFIYSRFINPNASIWTVRYFVVLIPSLIYSASVAFVYICDRVEDTALFRFRKNNYFELLAIGIITASLLFGSIHNLSLLFTDDTVLAPDAINVRKATAFMLNDQCDKEKLIITNMSGNYLEGWKEFYVKNSDIKIINKKDINPELLENKTIYLFCPHSEMSIPELDNTEAEYNEYFNGKVRKYL